MKSTKKIVSLIGPTALAFLLVPCAWSTAGVAQASGTRDAREILEASGVRGGLVVHVGCGDGRLTAALRTNDRYVVQGLDTNEENVAKAREYLLSLGCYGKVSIRRFDGRRLPYAENMVNLVVASGECQVASEEIARVLAPGGVAFFLNRQSAIENRKWVKPWPEEIDEWSHWRHGPDANPVAKDRVVGPPRHVQWVAAPRWQTHHDTTPSLNAMVSGGGRVFYTINEVSAGIRGLPGQWRLAGRDAFNGILLWKRSIPQWGWEQWSHGQMAGRFNKPIHLSRRLVAADERVYVTLGFNAPVTALNPATGETVRTYEKTKCTSEIISKDGILLLSVNQGLQGPGQAAEKPAARKRVMAVEAKSGEILWATGDYAGVSSSWDEKERITRLALAVGDEHVFFLDGDNVVAVDLDTGQEAWRAARPDHPAIKAQFDYYYPNLCTLVYQDGVVLLAQPKPVKGHVPYTPVKTDLLALSADTGEELWTRECYNWGYGSPPDIFVIDGLVWVHEAGPYAIVGLDLASGEVTKKLSTTEAMRSTHHHRCYRDKATERFILTARRGTEFLDVGTGENILHHWMRGACRLGIMPANGLLYVPPDPCVCYITAKLNGLYALAPKRKTEDEERRMEEEGRLQRGPAYAQIGNRKSKIENLNDWPTYRHDAQRSGYTPGGVPAKFEQKWAAKIPGVPSSAVAVGERVFVASTNTHCLYALDARSGKTVWDYTAGAGIDTPPTVHGGLVLFGSADGWVYCLRASDGELVWRFRAAPSERQVIDHGQLASAWPLHGSVLVASGVAYACAGRSSFLDGGIYLYALDPATGEMLQQERIYSPEPDTGEMAHCELPYDMPPDKPGAQPDIMLTDGENVYLRHLQFNPDDLSQYSLAAGAERLRKAQRYIKTRKGPADRDYIGQHPGWGAQLISNSGLLDDSWFNQSYWTVGGKGHSRLLVFDSNTIYGVRAYKRTGRHARDIFVPGKKGYKLFAMDRNTGKETWAKTVPVRIRAMVLADRTLFAAGPPDVVPEDDPWAAFEGRQGAQLCVFSATSGEKLTEYELESPPVLDSMIAASGRLYLSTQDGRLLCFGGK